MNRTGPGAALGEQGKVLAEGRAHLVGRRLRRGGLPPFILHTGPELGSGRRFRSNDVLSKRHRLQGGSAQVQQAQGLRSRKASPSEHREGSFLEEGSEPAGARVG